MSLGATSRRAPVQGDRRLPKGAPGRDAGTISWEEHGEVWRAYAKRYGTEQSAERIAQRGGFGWGEIVQLTGAPPRTWAAR